MTKKPVIILTAQMQTEKNDQGGRVWKLLIWAKTKMGMK